MLLHHMPSVPTQVSDLARRAAEEQLEVAHERMASAEEKYLLAKEEAVREATARAEEREISDALGARSIERWPMLQNKKVRPTPVHGSPPSTCRPPAPTCHPRPRVAIVHVAPYPRPRGRSCACSTRRSSTGASRRSTA